MRQALLLLLVASVWAPVAYTSQSQRIAVLDFELRDLTLDPGNAAEVERTASIRPLLEKALSEANQETVEVSAAEQRAADKGEGYLFEHPDAAAELGRTSGAQWIVVGRVHKASFLFTYFKVHLVNVATGAQAADLVVEVKGPQKELTARGVDRLAEEIVGYLKSVNALASLPDTLHPGGPDGR